MTVANNKFIELITVEADVSTGRGILSASGGWCTGYDASTEFAVGYTD